MNSLGYGSHVLLGTSKVTQPTNQCEARLTLARLPRAEVGV